MNTRPDDASLGGVPIRCLYRPCLALVVMCELGSAFENMRREPLPFPVQGKVLDQLMMDMMALVPGFHCP